jgi:hypothetical protein
MQGKSKFSTRGLPMPAHSGEIISQIAPRSAVKRRAQFFGIDFVIMVPSSRAKSILRDGQTRHADSALGKATHTDPQFLFWAAS